jgi:hypothetical protein
MYAFGPEGGFYLGSCDHIYHPTYLISFMVTRRRCGVCKAPFHERLYDLFGLYPYMPISWELNQDNALVLHHLWDDDLVWSWQIHNHSHNKSNLNSQFLWEDDHEEMSWFARSWLVLELTMKDREISSTNASTAIGMSGMGGSNLDHTQMDGCGMKGGAHH